MRSWMSVFTSSSPSPSPPLGNPYPGPLANPYPGSWFNSYTGPRLNPNPIGIPPFQRRYKRSLSIFDDNRRSKNLANNAKQWQVEQRFTDRARESIKSHQPLHEINSYDRQGYFDIPTLLTDKTDNQMLVSIDETLDKSFQTATKDESNNQL
ncbi:unnamed protein product [Rotaria sordida]|uniref:Uncharacterized protein n=1 Tax=Rotaria sordida TaxID=392033 RepID=A0A814DXH2_9BILA|nr:unnamed protein product [Rotaria sordida]CAF1156301.1 unnamed protein product [Rotaria sordida]